MATSTFEKAMQACSVTAATEIAFSINSVASAEPDGDGDMWIRIEGTLENNAAYDIDKCVVTSLLFDSEGRLIESMQDTKTDSISSGDSICIESSMGINVRSIGESPELMKTIVMVRCFSARYQSLGVFSVPDAIARTPIGAASIDNKIDVVTGSISKSAPDSDGEARVSACLLLQNRTSEDFSCIEFAMKLFSKKKKEIFSGEDSASLAPGNLDIANASTYCIKEKQLIGASLELGLRVYAAAGMSASHFDGLKIESSESYEGDQDEDAACDEDSEHFERTPEEALINSWINGSAPSAEDIFAISAADFSKAIEVEIERNGWSPRISLNVINAGDESYLYKYIALLREDLDDETFSNVMSYIDIHYMRGCAAGGSWEPRLIPGGRLAFRNYHRVKLLAEEVCGVVVADVGTTLKALREISDYVSNKEKEDFDFCIIQHDANGIVWANKAPQDLPGVGQSIVVLSSSLASDIADEGFDNILCNAVKERSGPIAIRIYSKIIFLHDFYRGDDALDTLLEFFSFVPQKNETELESNLLSDSSAFLAARMNELRADIMSEYPFSEDDSFDSWLWSKVSTDTTRLIDRQLWSLRAYFSPRWDVPCHYFRQDQLPLFWEETKQNDGKLYLLSLPLSFLNEKGGLFDEPVQQVVDMSHNIAGYLSSESLTVALASDYSECESAEFHEVTSSEYLASVKKAIAQMHSQYESESEGQDVDEREFLYETPFTIVFKIKPGEDIDPASLGGLVSSISGGESLNRLGVEVPAWGLFQNYESGELESGNMASFLPA